MSRYDELLAFEFPRKVQRYDLRETILYALGVGAGEPPDDPAELQYIYENGLVAIPSMVTVLASPNNWYRDLPVKLNYVHVVHASERFVIHSPVPIAGVVSAQPRIVAIYDKGPGRGALIVTERLISDERTGARIATVWNTGFCRSDGGLGGPTIAAPPPHQIPGRPPDKIIHMPTCRRAALIYRLCGDDNPLHIDPAFAAKAGFRGPILHGLSTYGHIARAILRAYGSESRLTIGSMDCRFKTPVYPGEAISVALWCDGSAVSFRAYAAGRVTVDNGLADLQ